MINFRPAGGSRAVAAPSALDTSPRPAQGSLPALRARGPCEEAAAGVLDLSRRTERALSGPQHSLDLHTRPTLPQHSIPSTRASQGSLLPESSEEGAGWGPGCWVQRRRGHSGQRPLSGGEPWLRPCPQPPTTLAAGLAQVSCTAKSWVGVGDRCLSDQASRCPRSHPAVRQAPSTLTLGFLW